MAVPMQGQGSLVGVRAGHLYYDGKRQEIRPVVFDMIAGKFVYSTGANVEGHW